MSDETQIVPLKEIPASGVDLNVAVDQARKIIGDLKAQGIEKAIYTNGPTCEIDEKSKTATVVSDGLMVQQREHSTTVTIVHEGSDDRQAIEELAKTPRVTQELLGAFAGKSQPWASRALTQDGPDE
jgi:hypothetical protein